jgi:hypothetical protein
LCFPSPTRFVEPRKIRNPKVIGTRIIPLSLSHATIDNQETIELKSKWPKTKKHLELAEELTEKSEKPVTNIT